jgi:hypothetical protein
MIANHSTTIQDLILPIIPIIPPSPFTLPPEICQEQDTTEHNEDMYHSISIKNEKVEPSMNLSSPVLKPRKECSTTTFMAKTIDRRREEVKERLIAFKKRMAVPKRKRSRSTQRKQSSSTTTMELILDSGFRSQSPTNLPSTIHDNEDIFESKSFIHNLDFNTNIQLGTNE